MHLPDIEQPIWFLLVTIILFAVVMGRYVLIAGIFYCVFYLWYPSRWEQRRINKRSYKKSQLRKEVGWSCLTALIFSVSGTITLLLWQHHATKIYLQVNQYPLWWLPVSFLVALLLHETYYYWLHRWMHLPLIFKSVHKVHHESNITSPWTAFSFHPLEGFLQALFLPLLLLVLPLHGYVLLLQLTVMTFSSVVNHLDVEIYPKNFHRNFFGKWMIGATHHSLHHRQFRFNYGLYFTFWDKWKNTESPLYPSLFEEKTAVPESKQSAAPQY